MKFYYEKLKELRNRKKYSADDLAQLLNISRTTLWKWEKGLRIPRESEVRMICNMLDIKINEISDLEPDKAKSKIELSNFVESWLSLTDFDSHTGIQNKFKDAMNTISTLNSELNKASVIVKSLLMSTDSMFYIKDTSLKYITANAEFLKSCGLNYKYKVFGSSDTEFFSQEEAKNNHNEDLKVLSRGVKIKREDFIPGSKKKKWGLITKNPTFDTNGDITGVLCTFIDFTEKKKQEKIRELIEMNLNSISAGFSLFDVSSGKYLYLNKERENILGYSNETFLREGIEFFIANCVHPDFKNSMRIHSQSKMFSGITEYKIILPDGKEKWVQDHESRIHYFNKICGISVTKDVTEHYTNKELEIEIPEQLKRCIDFHGSFCPELAIGYIIAKEFLSRMNIEDTMKAEIFVNCSRVSACIDAFQIVLGTTLGKGNLKIANSPTHMYTIGVKGDKTAIQFTLLDSAVENYLNTLKQNNYINILSKNINEFISIKKTNIEI